MTILDFIHPHATHTAEETQPVTPVIEEPSIEETVAPPAIVEPTPEVKKDEPVLTPEDTAASTVIEPLKDDVCFLNAFHGELIELDLEAN